MFGERFYHATRVLSKETVNKNLYSYLILGTERTITAQKTIYLPMRMHGLRDKQHNIRSNLDLGCSQRQSLEYRGSRLQK